MTGRVGDIAEVGGESRSTFGDDDPHANPSRLSRSTSELQFIQEYLVKPLADNFTRFEREMRDQLVGMRADFRETLLQNRATLDTITDATTGYVPRSEYQLMQRRYDEAIEKLSARLDGLFRWLVTTAIAAIGMGLEVANLATHHT